MRRLAFVLAAAALAAGLAAGSAADAPHQRESTRVEPQRARVTPHEAYLAARRAGTPIASLTRTTLLRSAPGGNAIATLARRTEFGSPRVLTAVGERHGWLRVIAAQLPNGGRGWIPASAAILTYTPWAIHASLSRREVTVLRGGHVVRRFPVAIGAAATPTPTGRFAVTDKINMIGRGPYGCCALALSGHQPNVAQGWTGGDRLAIHATTSPGTIGTPASRGCLRASDADARWLVDHVYLGTIVEIDA